MYRVLGKSVARYKDTIRKPNIIKQVLILLPQLLRMVHPYMPVRDDGTDCDLYAYKSCKIFHLALRSPSNGSNALAPLGGAHRGRLGQTKPSLLGSLTSRPHHRRLLLRVSALRLRLRLGRSRHHRPHAVSHLAARCRPASSSSPSKAAPGASPARAPPRRPPAMAPTRLRRRR